MPVYAPGALVGRVVVVVEQHDEAGKVARRDTYGTEAGAFAMTRHIRRICDVWVWQYNDNNELELRDRYSA